MWKVNYRVQLRQKGSRTWYDTMFGISSKSSIVSLKHARKALAVANGVAEQHRVDGKPAIFYRIVRYRSEMKVMS